MGVNVNDFGGTVGRALAYSMREVQGLMPGPPVIMEILILQYVCRGGHHLSNAQEIKVIKVIFKLILHHVVIILIKYNRQGVIAINKKTKT